MSKEQKALKAGQSNLTESSGGFMSVNRVDALVKNSSSIRGMTLPIVPSKPSSTPQPSGTPSMNRVANTAGNKGNSGQR